MKKLLILALVFLVVVAAVAHFSAASLVKAGVEKGGSLALGTDVHVGGASVSLIGGSVGLDHVHVHNPPGFKTHDALSLDKIAVAADVPSLLSDVVKIESIELDRPTMTIELTQQGTNIHRLLHNIDRGEREAQEAPKEPGKKLHVGRVVITEPKVKLAQTVLLKNERELALPTIELTDLGGESAPLTMAQLIERILTEILKRTHGIDDLPAELRKALDREAAGLIDELGEGLRKEVDGRLEELQEGIGGALQEGLDDLMGTKKKKKD